MQSKNDEQIVRGLRRGRQESWLAVHDAYAEQLWREIARLMPGDASAVGDMVQETLMEAARTAKTTPPF